MPMIDHISTYASNFEVTQEFYEAVFSSLGYSRQLEFVEEWDPDFPTRRISGYGNNGKADFWIIETRDITTPRHVAFAAESIEAVDAFYTAALANGGTDNGAPGPRPMYHENYYGAFVYDPDGNNVEAVFHGATFE